MIGGGTRLSRFEHSLLARVPQHARGLLYKQHCWDQSSHWTDHQPAENLTHMYGVLNPMRAADCCDALPVPGDPDLSGGMNLIVSGVTAQQPYTVREALKAPVFQVCNCAGCTLVTVMCHTGTSVTAQAQ